MFIIADIVPTSSTVIAKWNELLYIVSVSVSGSSIICDVSKARRVTGMRVTVSNVVGQLTTGAVVAAASRVQWDKMSVVVHQGDNVTLVCTVRPVNLFDVVRLTLTPSSDNVAAPGLHLHHSAAESARQRWTIADNDVVKPPFLALPRYSVTMTVDSRRAMVRLKLTGE